MNKQEETYFAALSKDRSEIADVLERRAVRGYKDSVVEKYSDQAHFIYELLQNADDACATRARFILEENRLVFGQLPPKATQNVFNLFGLNGLYYNGKKR